LRFVARSSVSRAFVPPWSHTIVADRSRTRQRRVSVFQLVVNCAAPGTLAVF